MRKVSIRADNCLGFTITLVDSTISVTGLRGVGMTGTTAYGNPAPGDSLYLVEGTKMCVRQSPVVLGVQLLTMLNASLMFRDTRF